MTRYQFRTRIRALVSAGMSHDAILDDVLIGLHDEDIDELLQDYIDEEIRDAERELVKAEEVRTLREWRNLKNREQAQARRERERAAKEEAARRGCDVSELTAIHFQEASDTLAQVFEDATFGRAILASSFALGDGRSVTWGEATADEHAQRIDMMQRHIDGCQDDVALHAHAVALLTRVGATCLNECADALAEVKAS